MTYDDLKLLHEKIMRNKKIKMEVDTTKLASLFIGIIGLIILPLGFIWSINNLFAIKYRVLLF